VLSNTRRTPEDEKNTRRTPEPRRTPEGTPEEPRRRRTPAPPAKVLIRFSGLGLWILDSLPLALHVGLS
jgi:hypothetical protein